MTSMRKPESFYTEDEYLALERASQERREYLDGQIYSMASEKLSDTVAINSIQCTLRLTDVYDRMVFSETTLEEPQPAIA